MVKCANPDCQYTFVDILEKGDSVFVRIDTEIGKRSMLLCHVCAEALLKEWTNSD